MCQGTSAMTREFFLFCRVPFPWGIDVGKLENTPLWWWAGEDDRNCDGDSGVLAKNNQLRSLKQFNVKVGATVPW